MARRGATRTNRDRRGRSRTHAEGRSVGRFQLLLALGLCVALFGSAGAGDAGTVSGFGSDQALSTWTIGDSVDLRIDASSGKTGEFGGAKVAVFSTGNIAIYDALSRELRVFGQRGEFLRVIGRRGRGPESFRLCRGCTRAESDCSRPRTLRGHAGCTSTRQRGSFSQP
jgi:hypothetical protein